VSRCTAMRANVSVEVCRTVSQGPWRSSVALAEWAHPRGVIMLAALQRQTGHGSADYVSAYGFGLKSRRSIHKSQEAP
jgi:hypothetical protein